MAEALAPVVTTAIDYKAAPVADPPPTHFPYWTRKGSEGTVSPFGSNSTLYDAPNDQEDTKASKAVQDATSARPLLAARKFDTEIARPVAQRLPPPTRLHVSTINDHHDSNDRMDSNGHLNASTRDAVGSSDSDGWSSSDDESSRSLQRLQTAPDGHQDNPLAKSHLNRVRTSPRPSNLRVGNEFFQSRGRVAKDGRLNLSINEKANTGYLAKALGASIQRHLGTDHSQDVQDAEQAKANFIETKRNMQFPRMNIVIMVIGSRGDIQPFLKIGKILRDKYQHRVRIATHPTFKKFIEEDIGLEFFSVGGDPSELMAFMVKNPGLIPSLKTVKAGEIGKRRDSMYQMFQGFWRACVNATDDEMDTANLKMIGSKPPFIADAIIANPPSFAHYHCAERLSIPLHLIFTFPYSPTQAFPHPLANIKSTNVDQSYVNFMSYPLVDLMTWQGLGDLVNRFRVKTLGLEPVSTLWAPGQLSRLRVPATYLWSPGLVPKPEDWGPEIDIAGYVFLDLASSYKPPQDLANFLEKSDDDRPLIYIGFGSISGIADPTAFTRMIFDAVAKANVRAVISKGWGGMGEGMEKPPGVFMIDNVPHDWLFPKVDAVVHHGGAGTTAAGLRFGKPTMIVPFFGDQPFWSAMVAKAGAGAKEALPLKKLDSGKFADGIRQCLEPDAKAKAQEIAKSIELEGDGAENAVDSFHRALPLDGPHSMRCDIFPNRVAAWKVRNTSTQLSALAADLLVDHGELLWHELELKKNREWNDFQGPGEPITGTGGVVVQAFQEAFHGFAAMHEQTKKDLERYEKRKRRKRGGGSATDAVVLPGKMFYAVRGASVEQQRKDHAQLEAHLKLQGQAEPVKLPGSSSRSDGSKLNRATTASSEQGPSPALVIMKDVGKGLGHSTQAIVSLPLRMWNAMALGFHNAPRLYGDKTVRPAPQEHIIGFRTGVAAAGTEFWFGIYDGVTGLVRIPWLEVHDDGISALPKGMAKGVGGVVLKPISGVLGLGAYTFKGIHQSIRRRVLDTEKTDRWIRRARISQGQRDATALKEDKRNIGERSYNPRTKSVDLRNHALRQWTTYEKPKVLEAREKKKRKNFKNLIHGKKGHD